MDPLSGNVLLELNAEIDEEKAAAVQDAGIEKVKIRSVLTCASRRGVCAKCYGRDLATGKLVEMGLAVGVVAAQSIGEPGTQLTMRTFHIGGTASRISERRRSTRSTRAIVQFDNLQVVERPTAQGGNGAHRHEPQRLSRHSGRQGPRPRALPDSVRRAPARSPKAARSRTARSWSSGIRTRSRSSPRRPGQVRFKDIIEGLTVHEDLDEVTGLSRLIIVDSPDEKKQPTVEIKGSERRASSAATSCRSTPT